MGKYGEFLFEAESNDIKECLNNLTEEDVEYLCDYKIFNRGYDYYHEGVVEDMYINQIKNSLSAVVQGTRKYDVEIYIDDEDVLGNCSCEYYDVCKHIIATLLNVIDEGVENISENKVILRSTANSFEFLESHLKNLSKEELIKLVMKFAPENYIVQIQNSKIGKKNALEIFNKVEKNVLGFFQDDELLLDPSDMEAALMGQLNKLKGLENQLPDLIGKLILKIMVEINDAFDEGYLYIDNYYEEDYFESQEFDNYVISYIKQLPFKDKIKFLPELDNTLGQMSYNTFEQIPDKYISCFTEEESKQVANYIIANISNMQESFISNLFDIIERDLSIEEKETILDKISGFKQDHFIALLELLISQNRHKEAYEQVEKYLSINKGFVEDKIIELYLDLCVNTGSDFYKAAMVSINHNPNEKILLKIKSFGVVDIKAFEDILKNKNPNDFLSYLEKEKRLKEAFYFISEKNKFHDNTIFLFFKRNKKDFRLEAEQYFLSRINSNLSGTGESFYAKIAETISQLKEINNKLSQKIVADIRTNYKRRTKLMNMLQRF
ncbi:MAG: SWIM zinc finger family protein [Bacteroidota bacterium]